MSPDRPLPDVLQGVLEVTVWVQPVDDRRADYRVQGDRVSGASLAARGLESLPGDDKGLSGLAFRELRKADDGTGHAMV